MSFPTIDLSFRTGGMLFGICLIAFGVAAWVIPMRWRETWRHLPRERWVGGALGFLCLGWSLSLLSLMLEGWTEMLQRYQLPLTLAVAVACIFLLDYLFTRALAAAILLSGNWVMHMAFVDHAPNRWAISIVCYLLGVVALFMIAEPFRFRDLLKQLVDSARTRHAVGSALCACGLITLAIAVQTHGG